MAVNTYNEAEFLCNGLSIVEIIYLVSSNLNILGVQIIKGNMREYWILCEAFMN